MTCIIIFFRLPFIGILESSCGALSFSFVQVLHLLLKIQKTEVMDNVQGKEKGDNVEEKRGEERVREREREIEIEKERLW